MKYKNWQESKLVASIPGLFKDKSELSGLNFSALHRAYLGIANATFEEALAATPRSAIDTVDATQRTVLSWACARGDCYTTIRLLTCGADPDQRDATGQTPLHWSTYARSSCAAGILLAAKADVDRKNRVGQTALLTLGYKYLSPDCSLSFLQLFAKFGADLNSADNIGWTPLIVAASANRFTMVAYLLEHGVNVNCRSKSGVTALSLAVFNNSHQSLKLLLQSPALVYDGRYFRDYTLLHQAAHFADIDTLGILQAANLGRLDIEASHGAFTAQQCAQRRRDHNGQMMQSAMRLLDKDPIQWYAAFESLLDSVRAAKQKLRLQSSENNRSEEGSVAVDDLGTAAEEVWEDAPESLLEWQPRDNS